MSKKSPEELAKEGATVAFFAAAGAVTKWLGGVIQEAEEEFHQQRKALPEPKKQKRLSGGKKKKGKQSWKSESTEKPHGRPKTDQEGREP